MTRRPGEIPEPEEALLGIVRATPEQEAEAKRVSDEKAELRKRYLTGLMTHPLFREWLIQRLVGFGTFENAFGNSPTGFPDPNASWFKAGMKAAGWSLWEEFDGLTPELASQMRREFGRPDR